MFINRLTLSVCVVLGILATPFLGPAAQPLPKRIKTEWGFQVRLEGPEGGRRLDTPGAVVRGEPWVFGDRAAWIEETTETATVRVWTGTAIVVFATDERGRLLDPAIGVCGVAWSRFIDTGWRVELDRRGERTLFGEPSADNILPVVGDTGISWIGSRGVEVLAYTTLGGLSEPVRLPGSLAYRLRCRGDTLFWVSSQHPHPIAWAYRNGGPQELGKNLLFSHERVPPVSRESPAAPPAKPLAPKVVWEHIEVDPKPEPRTTHAFLSIGEGRALVFAGEIWDSEKEMMKGLDAETWILDTREKSFTKVDTEEGPSPRCHTAMVYDPTRHLAFTWGGGGYDLERGVYLLDDTWLFDTEKTTWKQVKPNTSPSPNADAGLVYDSVGDRFVIYRHGEVWAFDPISSEWTKIPTSPGPAPRTCASLVMDPVGNQLLLFGGTLHPKYFDETWLLDLSNGKWREIREGPRPSPRVRAAIVYDPESRSAVVYGGVHGPHSLRFEDLWRFRFATERWELLESSNPTSIGKRGGYFGMVKGESVGEFFLFGGRSDSVTFHNDLWRLHIGKVEKESQ